MLAMEMKSAGVYVSRGLSYRQAEVSSGTIHAQVYVGICTDLSAIVFTRKVQAHVMTVIYRGTMNFPLCLFIGS